MNKQQINAIRILSPVVREMNKQDSRQEAVLVVNNTGYRIEYWHYDAEEDIQPFKSSRGWLFNGGGPSSDRKNIQDIVRWCI